MVFRKHLLFIAPILLVASFAAYFNWTKEKPKTKVHDEKMYYQGKIFRKELVKKWRGQPNKFLSDFSEFCTRQFVGLTLIQAQDKMLGAGQKFEFIEAKSVPMCLVPCDHIPRRSWPLFRAKAILNELLADLSRSSSPLNQRPE